MEKELLKLPICPQCNETKYVTDRWCRPMACTYYYICYRCCINWSPELGVEKNDWLMENKHKFIADTAYRHWADNNKPYGRDQEFWLAAEREYYGGLKCMAQENK